MPDLLFLTQRIPYPPIKGEKIRPLQMLKHLGRHYDVHLGCLIDDPSDWQHVDTVKALCRDIHCAPLDRRIAKLTCTRGLLTGEALSVTFFQNHELARWINGVLDRVRPEVVFICSGNMAPYVLGHPYKPRVRLCDLADVDSEKWREYAEKERGPMRFVYAREARLIWELEHRIAQACDFSTFVSEPEAALFRRLAPDCAAKVFGISSGVDYEYFDPAIAHAPVFDTAQPSFVFTGTMDYTPNVDAVTWFAQDMLPAIRRRLPAAQFYIVGSSPAPAVQRLDQLEGVHVTGRVPDVRPYVAHATACVAPMRIARGIQNKVLEGMAMGRPTIVTPQALEGIEAEPGKDVILANDASAFIDAACKVVEGDAGREIGAAARRQIVEHYTWAHRLRGFDRLLGLEPAAARPRAVAGQR